MTKTREQSKKEWRKFGLTMAIAFTLFATLFFWREKAAAPWLAGFALLFGALTLLWPAALAPIQIVWMKFAEALGWIMNRLILSLTYFIIMTPMNLLLRLLRKDILALKFDADSASYWADVEKDGPASRPDKPY